jgi:glycosyltransferase involved in cell wall biosynthesis
MIRNAALLSRYVLSGQFDLVHSNSRLAYLGLILPLALPKLMTYHRKISRRSVHLGHQLSRGTLRFSGISRGQIRDVQRIGTWHVVFNGVPIATYRFVPDPGPNAPLIFLGRVEEVKGPHLAIDVARRVGLRLVIAGNVPSEHRDWFEVAIRPHLDGRHISYVGPVSDAEKSILLGGARALVMPILLEEPFGLVMAEAMACGTPVIGFRRGAVPEVVEDGVTGFVTDDLSGLVAAVARLDQIDRAFCRDRAERYFSQDALVEGYLAIYRDLLSAKERKWIA